jgi:hypothetical protein
MAVAVPPTIEKRTYSIGPLFYIRTVCGMLVSRPLVGEAIELYEQQWQLWQQLTQAEC